ncbi:DUF4192 domain-containing protein [bacterium RCC_150]
MTADNRVTIARPEDILGFIPHALGLWPRESLVAITLRGRTLGATLRVDLPTGSVPAGFTSRIREYLEADQEADGVLLAVFSEDGWADGEVLEKHQPLLSDLELALALGGLELRDAWLVGAQYWRSVFCTDEDCCPIPGRPVAQIHDSRLNAEMVFRGSSVGDAPQIDEPARQASGGACHSEHKEVLRAEDVALEAMLGQWRSRKNFEELLDVWTRVLASGLSEEFDTDSSAFLRASLRVPAWRDGVVVMAAAGKAVALGGAEAFGFFGGGSGRKRALEIPAGLRCLPNMKEAASSSGREDPVPEDLNLLRYGDVLLGLYPELPDWAAMTALDRVLSALAGQGGGEARASALTLQGWIRWCQGSGSFAGQHFSQATAEQPGYRLAELLAEVVRRGTLCGWAKNRSSAWQRFEGTAA